MQRNLPKSVTIGGHKVKILVVKDMEDWGGYNPDEKVIRLSSRCLAKAADLRSTLRHELMHAAMYIGGVAYMEGFQEEPVVRCFDDLFFPAWDRLHDKLEKL